MWPFRRRRQTEPARRGAAAPAWSIDGEWRTIWEPPRNWIHGESHYTPALRSICGRPRDGGYLVPVDVHLELEPTNEYDENAVRALVGGQMVGRISAAISAEVAAAIASTGMTRIIVPGVARGGSKDGPNIGVHIWLDRGENAIKIKNRTGRISSWPPLPDEGQP